jgi:hypothetical protein
MTPLENLELAANSIQQPELHEEVCAVSQSYRNISLISAEFRQFQVISSAKGVSVGMRFPKSCIPIFDFSPGLPFSLNTWKHCLKPSLSGIPLFRLSFLPSRLNHNFSHLRQKY